MNLYHGTILEYAENIINNGIDVKYKESQRGTDFGRGFYTTNSRELAVKTAITRSFYHQDDILNITPVVLTLKYDIHNNRHFRIKTFNSCNNDWKKFICANRYSLVNINNTIDSNKYSQYDLVIGAIADSSMLNIKNELEKNNYILSDHILNSLDPLKIGNHIPLQYSFHNQELVSCIRVIGYDIIHIGRS